MDTTARMAELTRQFRGLTNTPPLAPVNNLQLAIQQEVQRQLAELKPAAPPPPAQGHIEQALMVLLQKSLPAADMEWLTKEHIPAGAPGFVEFMQSETMQILTKMGFDAYKEFLAGDRK